MKHAVNHSLDQATARKAADKAFETYAQEYAKYDPTAEWTSDTHCDVTFTVKGVTLRGALDLLPGKIEMDLDVPFWARPFKGRALAVIEREIRDWVGKAERGELE
jgi:hypothetical protein